MAEKGLPPTKNTFKHTARLLDDFFKIDEYKGKFELFDNEMSAERRFLVFERGDAAAALLFDPVHEDVILVDQFRLPTLSKGRRLGWILEPAAGMIPNNETPTQTIIREVREETGFDVKELLPIATFFVSPGGTSERIHLFYAEVRQYDRTGEGGGIVEDGEDTQLVRIPQADFFTKLRNGDFEDAKLIIAGQWLRERRSLLMTRASPVEKMLEKVIPAPSGKTGAGTKIVAYRGDIGEVKSVDVWVNPLSTDMLLDRFTDHTVSAVIRRRGAEKYPDSDRIKRDSIGEDLLREMGGRNFVKPGTVIETAPRELKPGNGVKLLLHVAAAKGEIGEDVAADRESLDKAMRNILQAVRKSGYSSVLVPMLGTGDGGLPVQEVAPQLLKSAIEFVEQNPNPKLKQICFLAYSNVDFDVLEDAIRAFDMRFAK